MGWIHQTAKATLAATLPRNRLLVRGAAQTRKDVLTRSSGTAAPTINVCLTFDDGPHPEHTPRLLDYLAAAGISGTFFVVGQQAKRFPQLIHRIVDNGHELGNHTDTHSDPAQTSTAEFLEEIQRTRFLLQDLTGADCRLVRPPKGKLTLSKLLGLWREKQTVVLWSVDPCDYAMTTRREMERWCLAYGPAGGDILLMHDNHPYASTFIETIPDATWDQSVHFARVSDWLTQAASSVGTRIESFQGCRGVWLGSSTEEQEASPQDTANRRTHSDGLKAQPAKTVAARENQRG